MDDQCTDLRIRDFVIGIVLALGASGVEQIDLETDEANAAAKAAFDHLQATCSGMFDLKFQINLHPAHRQSYDWLGVVSTLDRTSNLVAREYFGRSLSFRLTQEAYAEQLNRHIGGAEVWLELCAMFQQVREGRLSV